MATLKAVLLTSLVSLPLGFGLSLMLDKRNAQNHTPQSATTPKIAADAPRDPIAVMAPLPQNNEVALLKKDLLALRVEVAALKEEWRQLKDAKPTYGSPLVDSSKKKPMNEEELQAAEEKYFSQQGEALETLFRQQTIALDWSKETEAFVRKGLATDKISADTIIALECRSSICRLELANGQDGEAPDFIQFSQQIAGELPNIINSQTESGVSSSVFYLSKEELILAQ